ncbi:hypothetical protein CMZ82_07875 [Lysobacteraceae bacterium NML93-0792]|nr:hypothetical protein CMZ82_07875 [Xanthomonadaceae bacterium NML93-0792]PBS15408.1 hypothetical protein CMZ81_11125 [Xanthomonadaceae bacterium NML93-0793]PBS18378.1 hypothetical protein CMZ80_12190 [Xanthomonadaceae bacterium NML93-0831]
MNFPPRPAVHGPTFIRLLARLTDDTLPQGGPAPAERLSQWLDWTRAVVLSKALDAKPVEVEHGTQVLDRDDAAVCAKARTTLLAAISGAPELAVPQPQAAGSSDDAEALPPAPVEFAPFRQRHLALQRSMLIATGRLRGDLRERLAQRSPEMARLAELDAVMEGALSPREHALLGAVPALLEAHFERLRTGAGASAADPSADWLDGFRRDMQSVLIAELDVRFQPVEGLLAALRTH